MLIDEVHQSEVTVRKPAAIVARLSDSIAKVRFRLGEPVDDPWPALALLCNINQDAINQDSGTITEEDWHTAREGLCNRGWA